MFPVKACFNLFFPLDGSLVLLRWLTEQQQQFTAAFLHFHINMLFMSHCSQVKLRLSYLVLESYDKRSLKWRQPSVGLPLHHTKPWQVIGHGKICLIWLLPEPVRPLRHSFSPSERKTQSSQWWKERIPAIREWMRMFFLCSPHPLRQPFITKCFPLV